MLPFLITFILLLLLSSFFICAIYQLTRHTIEIQPNNEIKIRGYILKFWSQWIEKIKETKKIYYCGEALEHKYSEIKKMFPVLSKKTTLSIQSRSIVVIQSLTDNEKATLENLIGYPYEINGDAYFIYIEEPVYYVPDWIRKPLSGCVTCMASVYGSVIWLYINHLRHNLFSWTNHKIEGFFLFWFIFIVLLSLSNSIIYIKTSKYVL